jgi:Tol biopolymer transport system component
VLAGGAVAAWSLGRGAPAPAAPPAPPRPPQLDLARARMLTRYGTSACAYSPTVSADGHVVFDRTQGDAVDLYEVALAGGATTQLTSAPNWEWRASRGRTPNEVLYLAQDSREQLGGIDALDLATGKTARLFDVWSADSTSTGDTVYYIPGTQREIRAWQGGKDRALVAAETGSFRLLTASPTGDRLAVIESTNAGPELIFIDLATSQIDRPHVPAAIGRPAFSSDGRYVYYVANKGIRRRELATAKDELVAPDVNAIGGIAVAPDGSALVYSDCGTRSRAIDVAAQDHALVDDPDIRVMNTGPQGSLVWLRALRGRNVVIVRDRAGHESQLSDPDQGTATSAALSPSGSLVAYAIGKPNPGIRVTTMAPGGEVYRLTDDLGDSGPMWLGDDRIVFMREHGVDDVAMYVVDRDGGPIKRFGALGRTLMGVHGDSVLAATSDHFVWIDAKTGAERRGPEVAGTVAMAAVSPNGKWLAIANNDIAPDLLRVSLDPPGKLERVGSLAGGQTATSVAATDDGRVIVVAATWSGDLHVIPAEPGSKL